MGRMKKRVEARRTPNDSIESENNNSRQKKKTAKRALVKPFVKEETEYCEHASQRLIFLVVTR